MTEENKVTKYGLAFIKSIRKIFNKIYCNYIKKDFVKESNIPIVIFILFIVFAIIRSIFAYFPKALVVYADELIYLDISRSILNGHIMVHNVPRSYDQILYPLLLSPFTLIKNQATQISSISILNSILMSSVIFPVYFLCKKIIKNRKVVLMILLIILILPDFAMTITFMAENLFYPLSAWLFYFVYKFWISNSVKGKSFNCLISAILCFLLYTTKIVALYFLFAFIVMVIFDMFFTKIDTKTQGIKYCILFLTVFGIMFVIYKIIMSYIGGGSPTYVLTKTFTDFYKLAYFFYAFTYNCLYALIAFFYFPVVYSAFNFKYFDKAEKNTFIFAVSSLIFAIGITSYTISVCESYPLLSLREHVRYYSPILSILLILFFKCLKQREIQNESYLRTKPRNMTLLFVFTDSICMLILFLFRFVGTGSHVDGVLLQIFSYLNNRFPSIAGDMNSFYISPMRLITKILLIVTIIIFTILLFKSKYTKFATYSLICGMISISIINNVIVIKQFTNLYKRPLNQINEAISVNNYLKAVNGNILILTNGFDNLLDTYITKPVNWAKTDDVIDKTGDNAYIDLKEQTLNSNYPGNSYNNLHTVDYIIASKNVKISDNSCEEIKLSGVTNYNIYKNKDNSKLYIEDNAYFPKKVGKERIINADEGIFHTQHMIDSDGNYVSKNKSGALIYGPYTEIKRGKYDFTFYYEYTGNVIDGETIGNSDINLVDIGKVVASAPLRAGEKSVTLRNVYVEKDIKQAEARIFTDKEGIKFTSIKIVKIE